MAIMYTGNMLASSFAGLIAAGVFAGLDGVRGLAGWRWYVVSFTLPNGDTNHPISGSSSSKAHSPSASPSSPSSCCPTTHSKPAGSAQPNASSRTSASRPTRRSARKQPAYGPDSAKP